MTKHPLASTMSETIRSMGRFQNGGPQFILQRLTHQTTEPGGSRSRNICASDLMNTTGLVWVAALAYRIRALVP